MECSINNYTFRAILVICCTYLLALYLSKDGNVLFSASASESQLSLLFEQQQKQTQQFLTKSEKELEEIKSLRRDLESVRTDVIASLNDKQKSTADQLETLKSSLERLISSFERHLATLEETVKNVVKDQHEQLVMLIQRRC